MKYLGCGPAVVGLLLLGDHMVVTVASQLVAPQRGKQTKSKVRLTRAPILKTTLGFLK